MSNQEKKPIGQLLKELGYITEEQIQVALEVQKIRRGLLGEILVELGFVSPREIAEAISTQSSKPFIDLTEIVPSESALKILDKNIAKQLVVLPYEISDDTIKVAIANPYDINAIDIVRRRSGKKVEVYVSDKESILKFIELYYFLLENPIEKELQKLFQEANPAKTLTLETIPECSSFGKAK
jgi:type IV pilus assembly protein PilB